MKIIAMIVLTRNQMRIILSLNIIASISSIHCITISTMIHTQVPPEEYLLEENEERSMIEPKSYDNPKLKSLIR